MSPAKNQKRLKCIFNPGNLRPQHTHHIKAARDVPPIGAAVKVMLGYPADPPLLVYGYRLSRIPFFLVLAVFYLHKHQVPSVHADYVDFTALVPVIGFQYPHTLFFQVICRQPLISVPHQAFVPVICPVAAPLPVWPYIPFSFHASPFPVKPWRPPQPAFIF